MIVVDVQLHSAITGDQESLCRVEITNDGTGTSSRGNYKIKLYSRGTGRLIRQASITGWPRNQKPAWRLIQAAMVALG